MKFKNPSGGKKSLSEIVKDAGNGITITLPTQTQELQPMAEHVTASLSCTCRQRHGQETSQVVIECCLLKPGHKKRKVNNRVEYVNLTYKRMVGHLPNCSVTIQHLAGLLLPNLIY